INLATGDFDFRHTNMMLQARIPIDFTLTYHSRDKYNGDVGVGWHHSFERHLEPRENGILYEVTPEGASLKFEPLGDGTYRSAPGVYDRLVRHADGSYTKETPQQWTYQYRKDGLLYRITDPNGNKVQLTYEGSVLVRV